MLIKSLKPGTQKEIVFCPVNSGYRHHDTGPENINLALWCCLVRRRFSKK